MVAPRWDQRSTTLTVTQIEWRVFGLHLILGVDGPLVVVVADSGLVCRGACRRLQNITNVLTRIFFNALVHSCEFNLRKSDPTFADRIRHVRDPKARMQVVWNYCKGKMVCEPDEPRDENDQMENESTLR